MFRWLRKPAGDPLAVSMSGLKLGDRLLVLGGSDTAFVAALAAKVGLTGRAAVVEQSEAVRRQTAAAVEQEGVLVETLSAPFTDLPFEADAFDVAVLRNVLGVIDLAARARALQGVHRVVRPGGRALVIDDLPSGGLLARAAGRGGPADTQAPDVPDLLANAGFRGVRTLAEREGLLFVEGVKANSPD